MRKAFVDTARSEALPRNCRLSVHGLGANNHFAHRFVFRGTPGSTGSKRVAVVLFCSSEALSAACAEMEIRLDMAEWWTPELNEP